MGEGGIETKQLVHHTILQNIYTELQNKIAFFETIKKLDNNMIIEFQFFFPYFL